MTLPLNEERRHVLESFAMHKHVERITQRNTVILLYLAKGNS